MSASLQVISKRDLILDAAEKLFAESGFNGTTTRAIAKKAGVNIAMLSYYFGSKEQLLHAVIERFSEDLGSVFDQIEKQTSDPVERMIRWMEAYVEYIFENPNHARIVYRHVSVSKNQDDIAKLVFEFNKIRNIVLKVIEDGIEAGLFHRVDPQLAITILIAPVNAIIVESNVMKHRLGIKSVRGRIYPVEFKEKVKENMEQLCRRFLIIGNDDEQSGPIS
ncbi:MAG: TetR/AcrR family transcriptional regulator [Balneolales bacterium]|nr:TetR/AcrR family transcriptional regulator [Balneolales bacterium]